MIIDKMFSYQSFLLHPKKKVTDLENIPPGTFPGFVITKTTNNTKVYYTWNNEHKYYQNINDPSDYKSFSTIQHPDDETLVFLFYNYGNCPKSSGAYLELSFSKIKKS